MPLWRPHNGEQVFDPHPVVRQKKLLLVTKRTAVSRESQRCKETASQLGQPWSIQRTAPNVLADVWIFLTVIVQYFKQIYLENKISCVTTAQHPQPPQRTPGQVIGPPSVPQPQMSPQVTSLHQTPENCQKVISYAKMFGVSNPQSWVRTNCPFVQTFVRASCDDINLFVDSCFKKKFIWY